MPLNSRSSIISVGKDGYIFIDDVKVAKFIPERQSIQFLDRDRRRCVEKGRETVEVKLSDLVNLQAKK